MADEADRPSPAVLVAGGVAVVLVVVFVAAVLAGSRVERRPGDRIVVVRSQGPAGITVVAGRCLDQRVGRVRLSLSGGGATLWEIVSARGSIDRRYVVGLEPPPFGFTEVVALRGVPAGLARAEVTFLRDGHVDVVDAVEVDPGDIEGAEPLLGDAAPPCTRDQRVGPFATAVLVLGALLVVAGYAAMLARRWGSRGAR